MPYPDSEYPSVLRGKDKRDSQRLLAAAPELLEALKQLVAYDEGSSDPDSYGYGVLQKCKAAITKAEGRGPMQIDLTDDQYNHVLMALIMAQETLAEMAPWEISDAELHARQLAVGGNLYRLLVKKGVTLVTD